MDSLKGLTPEMFERWIKIDEILKQMPSEEHLVVMCMIIDCIHHCDKKPLEQVFTEINDLRPLIEEVNSAMGSSGILE